MQRRVLRCIQSLVLCTLLVLGGCKKVNLDDDPGEQKKVVAVLNKYLDVFFEQQDGKAATEMMSTPFLLEQQIYTDLSLLMQDYSQSEMGQYTDLEVELVSAQFMTLEALKKERPDLIKKYQQEGFALESLYPIKIKVVFLADNVHDTDEGYAVMISEQGHWKIKALN